MVVDGDLGDKAVVVVSGLDRKAFKGFAVTAQLTQTRSPTWDQADHPGLKYSSEVLQMHLVEEVEERRIRWPALAAHEQRLFQRLSVPLGEGFKMS